MRIDSPNVPSGETLAKVDKVSDGVEAVLIFASFRSRSLQNVTEQSRMTNFLK